MRIDYVNGHDEFDGSLWFVDGEYVGHDDQYDVTLAVRPGQGANVEFHHRTIRADADVDAVMDARSLDEVEPLLDPSEVA